MGKTRSIVWLHFLTKTNDRFVCKYCQAQFKRNATRQLQHLLKCKKVPVDIKKSILNENEREFELDSSDALSSSSCSSASSKATTSASASASSIASSSRTSATLVSFLDSMSDKENLEIDELVARAVYVTGAPLNLLTLEPWKEVFNKLRPAYKLPSRYKLSTPLLDAEVTRTEKMLEQKIKEASILTLQCDGWSNIRNDAITNYVINTPSPVLFKSIHTKHHRHTAAFLESEMQAILNEVGINKFLGIITDNGANIKKARESICQNNVNTFLVAYGCIDHGLSLLIEDVLKLKSVSQFVKTVSSVINEIKHSHVLHALFINIQQRKNKVPLALKLPVKTRWGSIVACLESIMKTKYALQAMAVDEEASEVLSKSTKATLLDENVFWIRVQKLCDFFVPLQRWITIFEHNDPQIHKVIECFREIKNIFLQKSTTLPVLKQEEADLLKIVDKRYEKSVHLIHLAANLLAPSCQGKSLSNDEILKATEFIFLIAKSHPKYKDSYNEIVEDLANYKAKEGLWAKDFVRESVNINPHVWWKGICSSSKLSTLAADVLSMPASTAATERTFSAYGFQHRARRNRLTVETAGKLTYVSYNYNLQKKISSKRSEHLREDEVNNCTEAEIEVEEEESEECEMVFNRNLENDDSTGNEENENDNILLNLNL